MGGIYVPRAYDYGPTGRITDIMLQQGRAQAEGAARSGEIWGNAIGQVGQAVGQAVQAGQERKAQTKRAAAFEAAIQSGDPQNIIKVLGPKDGPAVVNALAAHQPDGMKRYTDVRVLLRDQARGIKALPPEHRAQGYDFAIKGLMSAGIIKPGEAPEAYDENIVNQFAAYGEAPAKPQGLIPTAPGTALVDPATREAVFTNPAAPPKPPAPPDVGSFQDYLQQRFGPRPTPQQIEQARKSYQQADDRPFRPIVPIVIQGPEGAMLVDRTKGTASAVTDAGGKAVGQAPTSEQRNKAAARTSAGPVLDSIAELSEKINTGQGVMAKLSGAAERQKAKLNLDDDVAEYQAVVSGFTPMLARMVGHTGVLTEQDVQSVRTMLPNPGDSKSVRDRKIARIHKILGAQNAQAPGAQAGAGAQGPRQIKSDADYAALPSGAEFIAPDGSHRRKP